MAQHFTRQQQKNQQKVLEGIQRKLANRSSLTHSEVVTLLNWEIDVEREKHTSRVLVSVGKTKGIGSKTLGAIRESVYKDMKELPDYTVGVMEEKRQLEEKGKL